MTDTNAATASPAKPSRPLIDITPKALAEAKKLLVKHQKEDHGFRVGVRGGGCSGLTYVLDFDQQGPTEFDLAFVQHGVQFVIDKKSEFFMGGTILDFNDGLLDRGFVFKNPQASGTCGCGTSFSA